MQARLDPGLSRWLWLVKWLLLIPHYIVLFFLWVAFAVLTVVAFVAILITGRYPRSIFDFTVGVLRWSWRVAYYGYSALGTDRYPPFTLADDPDYPARFDVDYPERLSRGLVLVKWWLLAIPHYLVVGLFVGWVWGDSHDGQGQGGWTGGLISLLVLFVVVVLVFTGRYPRSLFDFILGLNRWALRVAGYATLMTDAYPPFRLDQGGDDPDGVLTPGGPTGFPDPSGTVSAGTPAVTTTAAGTATAWTPGRVVSVVAGALLAIVAAMFVLGGAGVLWANGTQRDAAGYVSSGTVHLSTGGYAVISENVALEGAGTALPRAVLGSVRLRVASTAPDQAVFVGVARTSDVERYLSQVRYATLTEVDLRAGQHTTYTEHSGGAPELRPEQAGIWSAQASGVGRQSLLWTPRSGDWTVVVMNADATAGVSVDVDGGADVPALPWLGGGMLGVGVVLLTVGVLLIAVGVARATAGPRAGPSEALPPAGIQTG